ncbi:MAG TPA: flagellin [Steroidobacteraceae bacterium]|nr:flagellin [Steroidobacteraceae bacterium]
MTGQVINTNIVSLNAQRNLSTSQSSLATALQRLSSGLRINSAKDDAAGLAIVNRFTTQIRGLNQAVRNANDGISLSQTAESALGELTNNLQRIRELAVQSANGTNSASDRAALDAEVQQRISEISRIATQTTFNGLRVLDGTFGTSTFQVGANVGDTVSVNFSTGVRGDQIGQIASQASQNRVDNTVLTSGSVTIAVGTSAAVNIGASVAGTAAGQTNDSAYAKVQAINSAGVAGLTATATNSVTGTIAATTGTAAGDTYSLVINGVNVFSAHDQAANGVLSAAQIGAQINLFSAQTGVSASITGGNLTLSTVDGRNIVAEQDFGGAAAGGIQTTVADATAVTTRGNVTLSAAQNITLGGTPAQIGFTTTSIALDTSTLTSVNVNTVSAANTAIQRVDAALTTVSRLRSDFGAVQNRFESTISNLQAVSENLEASRSRIQDADFASETAALTRAQILQQAGVAILAQANAVPQNVLGLLR